MRIDWLPVARHDRRSQIAYIRQRNPTAALAMNDAILSACTLLAEHPESGRLGRVFGSREFPVPGSPYLLVYTVQPSSVLILRLLHTAQSYP